MRCDYYIIKELRIQHENGVEYVEVSRKEKSFDSNEKYIQRELDRDYTKTIFADGKFVTDSERWKGYLVNDEFQFPERSYPEKYSNDLAKVIRATLIRRVEERTFLNV